MLAVGVSLSLYSIPVDSDGFHLFPFILPSGNVINGFILLQSPLVPILYIISGALLASGWTVRRGSVAPIVVASLGLLSFGFLIGRLVSTTIDFPTQLGGVTFHISPFWLYFQGPIILGLSLGGFIIIFPWAGIGRSPPQERGIYPG